MGTASDECWMIGDFLGFFMLTNKCYNVDCCCWSWCLFNVNTCCCWHIGKAAGFMHPCKSCFGVVHKRPDDICVLSAVDVDCSFSFASLLIAQRIVDG